MKGGLRAQARPTRPTTTGAREASASERRRLAAARIVCVVLVLISAAVFVSGLPAHYAEVGSLAGMDPGERAALRANLDGLGVSVDFYAAWFTVGLPVILALAFFLIAGAILRKRSDDPMALFAALLLALFGATRGEGNEALADLFPVLEIPSSVLESLSLATVFAFFFLFPDGRFVPRLARWPILALAGFTVLTPLFPGMPLDPKSWSGPPYTAFFGGWFLAGVGSQLYRYLRVSGPVQRQQTKWVFLGFAATLAVYLGVILTFLTVLPPPERGSPADFAVGTVFYGSALFVPLSIGFAVLRHRLWDVDVVINRAVVYSALTATLVCLYALVVGGLGALLRVPSNLLPSLIAAGLVAVLFAPLRERLQRSVNRLMYGERDDPYAVLSGLGRRLGAAVEPDAALSTIVETVAGALKLPYAAIAVGRPDGAGGGFEVAASCGEPTGEERVLPLSYGGETVGELVLAPRAPGEDFSPADRRLLEDLARSAGVAVQAAGLTRDLRRSRERLITAREEERRRLRRDLHDGLGPTLASLTLGLDVSLKLFRKDPEQAEGMLFRIKGQTKEAVVDIRRLVYGLRPPALDDLGLVAAIKEQAATHGALREGGDAGTRVPARAGLGFVVEAPEELPPLPAAVEVACYRIAQEAMTNVARHARASECRVRLSVDEGRGELALEIEDDGIGLPKGPGRGVGLSSMRERAEELGGTLRVGTGSRGGTIVSVRLTLPESEGSEEKEETEAR